MYPQYAPRDRGAEIALWLLLTVGALLIPIIIIAICCIRRHWPRRPRIKLMESRPPRMVMMMSKQLEALHSYNGPYTESGNDGVGSTTPSSSSIKKQHVHWPDTSTNDDFHSKQHEHSLNILHTTLLTESPSTHRRPLNSSLSHFIQTAIIPAGSTVSSIGASQFLTSSKELTSISVGCNSVM